MKVFFGHSDSSRTSDAVSSVLFGFRLVHDRELQLHDGKRLVRADRYDEIKEKHDKSDAELQESGVLRIHPSFRIIALAESPVLNTSSRQWLNSELLSLFLFHEMRPLTKSEELHIVRSKVSNSFIFMRSF